MKVTPLEIYGAWLIESPVFRDERGLFREWFKSEAVEECAGGKFEIAQANVSLSSKGTVRGIHYSMAPKGQAKWVTCVAGSIKDVIVDIRPNSPTFGDWVEVELSGDAGKAVFIDEGLGHGFLALEENTVVSYLMSTPFSAADEYEINPLDQKIGINWDITSDLMKISEKDRMAPSLSEQLELGNLPK
jgi:dTDP-4-dehydrorhamnose 3,5-epimerase